MEAAITHWPTLTTTKGARKLLDWDGIFDRLEREPGPFRGDLHPGWSAATFSADCRALANVERVTAMVLDYDGAETLDGAKEALGRWYGMLHTSRRHTPAKHRFRAILPLSRSVSAFEHSALWRRLDARWPGKLDSQAKDASRFWYLPGLADGATYETRRLTGAPLDPDEVLGWPEPPQRVKRPPRAERYTDHGRAARIIGEEADRVETATEGERNATLNACAFSLGQLVAGGDLSESDVIRALEDAALHAGLDRRETEKTIASGMAGGAKLPRRLPLRIERNDEQERNCDDYCDREPGDDSYDDAEPAWQRFGALTMRGMLSDVYRQARTKEPVSFISTCHCDLDGLMRGFRRGRVTILGALTSWGKSSYTIMVADEAIRAGRRVLIVTAEDHPDLWRIRIAARRANISAMHLTDGTLNDVELAKLARVADAAEDVPMMLNAIGRPAEWAADAVRAIVSEGDYELVIFDYLQAMSCAKHCQDRRNELTHIARVCTDACKSSNTSGLLVSQFKRLEKGAVPGMHDLKESGDLENMAEHVLLGWSKVGTDSRDGRPEEKRYIVLAKNKDGPKSREEIWLPFDSSTASFRAVRAYDSATPERTEYEENPWHH